MPAEQAAPPALPTREDRLDAFLAGLAEQSGAGPDDGEVDATNTVPRRPSAPGRQEPKAGPFLIRVPQPAALRVSALVRVVRPNLIHDADLALASFLVPETTGNLT